MGANYFCGLRLLVHFGVAKTYIWYLSYVSWEPTIFVAWDFLSILVLPRLIYDTYLMFHGSQLETSCPFWCCQNLFMIPILRFMGANYFCGLRLLIHFGVAKTYLWYLSYVSRSTFFFFFKPHPIFVHHPTIFVAWRFLFFLVLPKGPKFIYD